jgi:predicted unusual protein kinase regulating ubiquinone biosynthesis (AarF/ABC1/UbiB family)
MAHQPPTKAIRSGRLGRLFAAARTGVGAARSVMGGTGAGIETAVERLGELRGLATKAGQMAGLVEANLPPEVRERVAPALARLRAQVARSPYEAIARIVEEDLGAPLRDLFQRFDETPFASASLGQVHDATHLDGRRLAVKVQHPGIREAFTHDLQNVGVLGRIATSWVMPQEGSRAFVTGVQQGFLAELDYQREANNLLVFARLIARDPDIELPALVPERSSPRVLSTTFLRGEPVEVARGFPNATRARQAASVRRFVLSALCDHGTLYADAHAGNFLFREDCTLGVLDFGSVFVFDGARRAAFARWRDTLAERDRPGFGRALAELLEISSRTAAEAIADVQWIAIGGLVRGEAIHGARIREITDAALAMKTTLIRERFALPYFMPFLMRTMLATNALLAALDAPESGPLGRLETV